VLRCVLQMSLGGKKRSIATVSHLEVAMNSKFYTTNFKNQIGLLSNIIFIYF
jgi:hypothetical protein